MPEIELPYGRGKKKISLSDKRIRGVLSSKTHTYRSGKNEEEIIRDALNNPIDSPPLRELVRDKNEVVIISSDHTRPVPSQITMPIILEEIKKGNPSIKIAILVATGFHRASTERELRDKYGDKIVDEIDIKIHDSRDDSKMVNFGKLPSGGDLILNKLVMEAELLIAEGFIEPHFFAGFSGGRKSILPGIASKKTVLANHCSEFIAHEKARTGILEGNPLHKDMLYAAYQAKLAFILNVVINLEKKVINAFAGHFEKAHYQGCNFVVGLAGVRARPADIIITTNGGYPLDQNIYQSVKGMTAAEATCKEGGVIIMLAECSDGHGGNEFYKTLREAEKVEDVMKNIMARGRKETIPDQWESQILVRILLKFRVIMVTAAPSSMVEDMHMNWAPDLETALNLAGEFLGRKDASITVIPDGVSVIVH